jgi:hypothetical protein
MSIRRSALAATVAGGLAMALLAGCRSSASGSGSGGSSQPSPSGGAISSAVSKAQSAASSALSEISGGAVATDDVAAGPVTVGPDGHATSTLTVKNPTDAQHDYTVSVIFDDSGGGLEDVVVVTVSKVPAHGQASAAAKSNRKVSGSLTAKVSAAVRH